VADKNTAFETIEQICKRDSLVLDPFIDDSKFFEEVEGIIEDVIGLAHFNEELDNLISICNRKLGYMILWNLAPRYGQYCVSGNSLPSRRDIIGDIFDSIREIQNIYDIVNDDGGLESEDDSVIPFPTR